MKKYLVTCAVLDPHKRIVTLEYEKHEYDFVVACRALMDTGTHAEQRQAAMDILVLHEAKIVAGARMLTDEEYVEGGYDKLKPPSPPAAKPSEPEESNEQLGMLLDQDSFFAQRLPQSVRAKMHTAERDNRTEDSPAAAATVEWSVVNGWLYATPTSGMLRTAKLRLRDGDARKPNDLRNVGSPDQRLAGFVAEELFAAWLRERRVPFQKHGGPDGLPDYKIGSARVGLKFCGAKVAYRPTHTVYVFERHFGKSDEWVFFGNDVASERLILLGAISQGRLASEAIQVAKGVEVVRGFVAEDDLRKLTVQQLTSAEAWIANLNGGT